MRRCVIINPHAGSAEKAQHILECLTAEASCVAYKTDKAGHARELAEQAVAQGYDEVIAAGGDGTINEVVNGLATALDQAVLGVIPLGTGNDLARTLAIPDDPEQALAILEERRERRIDLIKVDSHEGSAYCANAAAGGFTGQVNEAMTEELKASWGPLAYLLGAASILPDLTGYVTSIACGDEPVRSVEALNIIVANGRTAAGGLRVAPTANPEDGLLDVVIVRHAMLLDLAAVAARLLAGNYLDSDLVSHYRVERVRIEAKPAMWFNIDGELLTKQTVTFSALPRALRIFVGPDYTAEPPPA